MRWRAFAIAQLAMRIHAATFAKTMPANLIDIRVSDSDGASAAPFPPTGVFVAPETFSLKAAAQPLVQIHLSTSSTETVKLPEPKFQERKAKAPLRVGERRLIIATCEKGTVEDTDEMKGIKAGLDAKRYAYPNFVDLAAREVFRMRTVKNVSDPLPSSWTWRKPVRNRVERMKRRADFGWAFHACSTSIRTRPYSRATSKRWARERKHCLFRLYEGRTLSRRRYSRRN
jgi:hypothetical protein